ncbi:MAG: biotin/lipoyl-binding protein [Stappiaceae bacterium]
MLIAVLITLFYIIFVWLVFFKFKLLKFNMVWGIVSFWVGVHLLLIFIVALRFYQPFTMDAHVIRYTVQIVPRLPEPTLLTEVLVEPNVPVKKGDPLYRFDTSIYQAKVDGAKAQLVQAEQNVKILQTDIDIAKDAQARTEAQLAYAKTQQDRYQKLVPQGGGRQDQLDRWNEEVLEGEAGVKEAEANVEKAQLAYDSQIDGVNTGVAQAQSQLDQAQYFLDQTTIYAPADGMVVLQQAKPGLVVGTFRIGSIASFVTEEEPFLLGTFRQQNLKFVRPGQKIEVALDLYPGEIFTGTVKSIWWATRQGQYQPSGRLPGFLLPKLPGRIAVEFDVDLPDGYLMPGGAHGAVAIYTGGGKGFEFLRRVNVRLYSWGNFIRPFDLL